MVIRFSVQRTTPQLHVVLTRDCVIKVLAFVVGVGVVGGGGEGGGGPMPTHVEELAVSECIKSKRLKKKFRNE